MEIVTQYPSCKGGGCRYIKIVDYITIHVPATDATKNMIDKDALGLMKKGVVVLNFARNVLVEEEAMVCPLYTGM